MSKRSVSLVQVSEFMRGERDICVVYGLSGMRQAIHHHEGDTRVGMESLQKGNLVPGVGAQWG